MTKVAAVARCTVKPVSFIELSVQDRLTEVDEVAVAASVVGAAGAVSITVMLIVTLAVPETLSVTVTAIGNTVVTETTGAPDITPSTLIDSPLGRPVATHLYGGLP